MHKTHTVVIRDVKRYFCHSYFREHSNRLSSSNSAGASADVNVLAVIVAGVYEYNCKTNHPGALMPSVKYGKQKLVEIS